MDVNKGKEMIIMKKQQVTLNDKTILVTGSPGFIGANLVLRLLRDLSSGTVISRLSHGSSRMLLAFMSPWRTAR